MIASTVSRPAPSPRQWWLGCALLLLFGVALGILESSPRAPLDGPRGLVGGLLSPLARAGSGIHEASTSFWSAFFRRDALVGENDQLRKELAELKLQYAIGAAQDQIADSRALIAPSLPTDSELVDAAVLGSAPASGRQLLWIARGADSGLEVGMVVVGSRGIVGTVHRVFPGTALVVTLSDAKSRWGALGKESGEAGIVTGLGKPGEAHLLLEKAGTEIHPGEVLVTTGQAGSSAPGGIPIGTMRELGRNRNGESVGIVEFAEDPASCRVVFVLKSRVIPAEPPTK